MPAGDGFTSAQRLQIDKAIRQAETACRYEFSVFVGPVEGDPREYAERLHAALVAPSRSVLILVDPADRAMEVVTGQEVRRHLDDKSVRLAMVEMESQFVLDDLVGGIVRGVNHLAQCARRGPTTLHA